MPKKIKTLKQKMRSDQRQHQIKEPNSAQLQEGRISFDFASSGEKTKAKPNHAIAINEYKYLSTDLMKTVILTSSIIIVELLVKQLTTL